MKMAKTMCVMAIVSVMAFAAILNADDTLRSFTQPTIDGKTIKSETLRGVPLVINFSSPW